MEEKTPPAYEYGADDRRAFAAATGAAARLDESLIRTPVAAAVYAPCARRREAVAIAAAEGFLVRQEALALVLGDRDTTAVDRGTRLAADLHDVLEMAAEWPSSGPGQPEIVAAFTKADASSMRLVRPDVQWSIEEDSAWLADAVAGFAESADPWTAAESVRKIWTSGRFFGTARRMALVTAVWALPRGFGCRNTLFGLAAEMAKDADAFREASHDQDAWAILLASAATAGYALERSRLDDGLAARASMLALCPPGRASSSVEAAVDFMFSSPVFTAKSFSTKLGLTPRGAKVVLDKLTEAGVLWVDSASRNRKYTCRRVM